MQTSRFGIVLFLLLFASHVYGQPNTIDYHEQILQYRGYQLSARVPNGFRLDLLTGALEQPRMMTFSSENNSELLIGSRAGKVYRLLPPYSDADVLLTLSNYPHSIAVRAGELLIAQTDGIYRAPYQTGQKTIPKTSLSLLAELPAGGGHSSRTLRIGPDQRLYVSLGISGNCSNEYIDDSYPFNRRRGGIMVLDETSDPARWQAYGTGLRNPIGFDWHPQSQAMYANNNGPDHWGYQLPREVFKRIDSGSFHGMPWFQYDGQALVRDRCIRSQAPRPIDQVSAPTVTFAARSAPMAVAFVPDGIDFAVPSGDAIVALHGSWATLPNGDGSGDPATRRHPKIVAVRFDNNNQPLRVDDLITGFQLADGRRWARPVGLAFGPDGALYFTSDAGIHGLFRLRADK